MQTHLDTKMASHHDVLMRTTLTLDRDVADRLKLEIRRSGKAMKVVVNEALRLGLGLVGKPMRPPRFQVRPHAFGFKPGVDLDRINQLVDELESEETARELRR
jgi:hypothetical protein